MNKADKEFITMAAAAIAACGTIGISWCIGYVAGEVWGWFTISLIASVCGIAGFVFALRS